MPGMVGAVLYAISGTLIGTTGYIVGFKCVDVFHYFLALANIALIQAL